MYNAEELVREAIDNGFSHAGELNIKALVFRSEVRDMCKADRCHQYGKNWRCPPACGSLEDAANLAVQYSCGIIVQTTGQMNSTFDYKTIESTYEGHKQNFLKLIKILKERYGDVLPMSAGSCTICESCTFPNEQCRFPDISCSSMEAYGLIVNDVCRESNIPYDYGERTITYISCYLLK